MFIEILISIILGIILGIITGLIPGIHTNLIASLALLFQTRLTDAFAGIQIIITLIIMLIIATYLNIIPSLLLGIPDPDNTNMIRQLHKSILDGKAYTIIKQISISLLISSIIFILLTPLLYLIITNTKNLTQFIPIILILIILLNLRTEKRKTLAISVILIAGILGILIFSISELEEPLLPLLSGLFGVPGIILTIKEKPKLKKQFFPTFTKIPNQIKTIPIYPLLAAFTSFIPAISSSQVTSIIKRKKDNYVILTSVFTITTVLVSIITVYSVNKARNGVVLSLAQFVKSLNEINILIIILTIVIAAILGSLLLIKLSKIILSNIEKINLKIISISVLILIIFVTFMLSDFYGLIVIIITTSLGLLTTKLELNRNYLMAALVIPTIFYFI